MFRMVLPFGGTMVAPAQSVTNNVIYLLRDEFTTDASAPLASPRTCEPGPGTLVVRDTGNKLSVASGKLQFTAGAAYGDPGAYGSAVFSRANGRVCLFRYFHNSAAGGEFLAGWSSSIASGFLPDEALYFPDTPLYVSLSGASLVNLGIAIPHPSTTDFDCAVIMRSAGSFFIAKGESLATDTLIWVSNGETGNRYAVAWGKNITTTIDNFRVSQLGGVWASDYGIATNRVASPTSPTATTSVANAIIEFTWTPAAAETLELDVRRTDADNRWIVRCDQAGNTIKLIERNAATETERASAAQTWNAGTARRIVVIQDGNTIKTFVENTAKNSYASASFNNTATGVNVAGFATGSNLVCYPRNVSAYIPTGL